MPFPATAGSDGFGVATSTFGTITSASAQWLTPQPRDMRVELAPRRQRGDGGVVKDGLDSVTLVWGSDDQGGVSDSEWDGLLTKYSAVQAVAGIGYLRYYDQEAGAFSTVKCVVRRPEAGTIKGRRFFGVSWRFDALGLA